MCRFRQVVFSGILVCGSAFAGEQSVSLPDGPKSLNASQACEQAIERTLREIEQVKNRLLSRRKEIDEERVAISQRVTRLTAEIAEKRRLARQQKQTRATSKTTRLSLRSQAERLGEQLSLARSLLLEATSRTESKLDDIDMLLYGSKLKKILNRLESAGDADESGDSIASAADPFLSFLADRSEKTGRVRISLGQVIGPDGRQAAGTFIQLGGVMALFASGQGDSLSGIVQRPHGLGRPHVWPVESPESRSAIEKLAEGLEATVPIDVTSGSALRMAEADRSLLDQLKAGGVIAVPILLIGAVCFLVALWKMLQLSTTRRNFDGPIGQLLGLLRAGRIDDARTFAENTPRPLRRVIVEGVTHRDSRREDLEEIMHEAILVEVPRLEQHLTILSVGAVVSPLLGLLGTVTGMIHTFHRIEIFGTGDPRMLSGGISEALVTTMLGLSVAIPLVLIHALLSRRVRSITDGLEKSTIGFINTLKTRDRPTDVAETSA